MIQHAGRAAGRHSSILGVVVTLLAAGTARADIFTDDFDRPDGVLGPPWEVLEAPLYIRSGRVVSSPDEFGLMMVGEHLGSCACPEASLTTSFNFATDPWLEGEFRFFIFGEDGGFIAKIAGDGFSIVTLFPETELVSASVMLDGSLTYVMRLAYEAAASTITLDLMLEDGTPVDELSASTPSEPLAACAIGIENIGVSANTKWIDDVVFESCCEVIAVPDQSAVSEVAIWPRPFRSVLHVSVTSDEGGDGFAVFDTGGRLVRRLELRGRSATWDGRDRMGHALSPGVYFVRHMGDPGGETAKVVKIE